MEAGSVSSGGGLVPKEIARYWWIPVIAGVIAVVAGILVLVYPGRTLLLLELAFGIFLIVLGLLRILAAILIEGGTAGQRWVQVLIGVLAILAGIFVATTPGFGLKTLALIFAIYLLVSGLLALYAAGRTPDGRGWNIARGLLGLLAGVVVIAQPGIGLVTLAVIGAIYLMLAGVVEIAAGLAVRKLGTA